MTKPSWEDLLGILNHIEDNRGNITSWTITKEGTWAEDERVITVRVRLYEPKTNE